MFCSNCKQECWIAKEDMSFSHEFGVQEEYSYGSDCCDADCYEYKCDSCGGTGIYELDTCPDCKGVGLTCKLDGYELAYEYED